MRRFSASPSTKITPFAKNKLAFVVVACPETTLIDSTEFYQPIVTPFELEIALK